MATTPKTLTVEIRTGEKTDDIIVALAKVHRIAKRQRELARDMDRAVAELRRITIESLGIEYQEVPK